MANAFEEIASQEKEHAKRLFKFLEGGEVEITAAFPAGVIGSTAENLKASAGGENHEYTHMYPEFADIAEQEGFKEIADVMRSIAVAEQAHEARFLEFLDHINKNSVFKGANKWRCLNCGYIHSNDEAPTKCPACDHPQAHFTTRMG